MMSTNSTFRSACISAGRVAKFSYGFTNNDSKEAAFDRAVMLIDMKHKSPFEHQLVCDLDNNKSAISHVGVKDCGTGVDQIMYSGRAKGWAQMRKLIWNGLEENTISGTFREDIGNNEVGDFQ